MSRITEFEIKLDPLKLLLSFTCLDSSINTTNYMFYNDSLIFKELRDFFTVLSRKTHPI